MGVQVRPARALVASKFTIHCGGRKEAPLILHMDGILLCRVWQRSAQYALRSHLYLLLHALVAGPAALWLGAGPGAQP